MIHDPLVHGYSQAVAVASASFASFVAVTTSIALGGVLLNSALLFLPSTFGLPVAAAGLSALLVAAYLFGRKAYRCILRSVGRSGGSKDLRQQRQLSWLQFRDEILMDCLRAQRNLADGLAPEPAFLNLFRRQSSRRYFPKLRGGRRDHAHNLYEVVRSFQVRARATTSPDKALIDDWLRAAVQDTVIPLSRRRRRRWADTSVIDSP